MSEIDKNNTQLLTRLSGEGSIPTEVTTQSKPAEGFYTPISTKLISGAPEWEAVADVIGLDTEPQWEEGKNPFTDLLREYLHTEGLVEHLVYRIYELKREIKVMREIITEDY